MGSRSQREPTNPLSIEKGATAGRLLQVDVKANVAKDSGSGLGDVVLKSELTELAQDAVGAMVGSSLQYVDATPLLDTIQDIRTTASPTFATAKLTTLTDTYIPKHTSDAAGLANSLLTDDGTNVTLTGAGYHRASTARYRRYYHMPLGSANPGASGPTWVNAGANTTGGWRLTNAAWLLRGQTDVHADWDGASDLKFEVHFMVNIDNTGGADTDTVDIKAVVYYKGVGETVTKSQTLEVATVVGKSPQYKQFEALFTIDWDAALNVVEVHDVIAIVLNLETDTSEVDDIVVTSMNCYYNSAHVGIESGDT